MDTEGFVLKVKVHSAKVMDHEGIKALLSKAHERLPRLCHLWLDAGYRGEDKRADSGVERGTRRRPTKVRSHGGALMA